MDTEPFNVPYLQVLTTQNVKTESTEQPITWPLLNETRLTFHVQFCWAYKCKIQWVKE